MSETEIAAQVRRAREAQKEWEGRPIAARVRAIAKAKQRLLASAGDLVVTLREERGKPASETYFAEVAPSADVFDYWLRAIEELVAPVEVEISSFGRAGKSGRSSRAARGIVALVTSASYPVAIPIRTLVPALLAGNAVIWKPSALAPKARAIVTRAFDGIIPEGLLSVVEAEGADAIIASGVDGVVFEGGANEAREILAACAKALTPASLDLGGKDAAIVLDDARLERTSRGIVWAAFANGGESSSAIQRVYVEKGIASKLIARVTELTKSLEVDGHVARSVAPEDAKSTKRQLDEAVKRGGEILVGGMSDDSGASVPATVVRVDDEDIELLRDRTLGPVLAIVVVDGFDAAATRVRSSRFGLTTSIWTRGLDRSSELAGRVGTPVVTFNCHGATRAMPDAPWSGRGESGFGVTNGPFALDVLTTPRFILEDNGLRSRDLEWYPYTPSLERAGAALAKARGGAPFFARIFAFLSLRIALLKRFFDS